MNSANWTVLLEPILQKYFVEKYKEIPSVVPRIFGIVSSKKDTETYGEAAEGGLIGEFNGSINYSEMTDGYKTTIKNKRFAEGRTITRDLWEDDQTNTIKKIPTSLATLAKKSREEFALSLFNHAFDAGSLLASGQNLVDTEHPSKVGGVAVQSNYVNTALTFDNWIAARKMMKGFKDLNGKPFYSNPDLLFVPTELEVEAFEIANSIYKPTSTFAMSANAAKQMDGLKIISSAYLTNPKAWFLIDSALAKECFIWQNKSPVELLKDTSFDQLTYRTAVTYRCARGAVDFRAVVGSAGG